LRHEFARGGGPRGDRPARLGGRQNRWINRHAVPGR
jgi:hypothetical protein